MENSPLFWTGKTLFIGILTLAILACPPPLLADITLVDAAGQHLTLERVPTRIVLVGTAPFVPFHMLYIFEETKKRLKGFEVKTKKTDQFLGLIDPDFSSKITLKTNPGPESVAALTPDLVILLKNGTLLATGSPDQTLTTTLLTKTYGDKIEVITTPKGPLVLTL